MKIKLRDKVVIITGASSGIGKAISYEFAKHGAIVILAARNIDNLKTISSEINSRGGRSCYIKTDVKIDKDCQFLIHHTINKYGKIDILINNAGLSMRALFEELDLFVIKELMDTNFYGSIYCTKYALPFILKEKGSIVSISSISGLTPLPGRTGYCASKHALNGFFESLRLENKNNNLHVLIVHPGFTNTSIRRNALNKLGLPQHVSPRTEDALMTSEDVAIAVLHATLARKNKIILTMKGKLSVLLYKYFPENAKKLIFQEFTKEPNSPI